MLNKSIKVAGITIAALMSSTVFAKSASALNFNFSFPNSGNPVSGTIFGVNETDPIADSVSITTPANVTFDSSTATSNSFTVAGGTITNADYSSNTTPNLRFLPGINFGSYENTNTNYSAITFSPAGATPVPFGVAPDLGILILAGMFGVSRLRNKIAARKLVNSNQAA